MVLLYVLPVHWVQGSVPSLASSALHFVHLNVSLSRPKPSAHFKQNGVEEPSTMTTSQLETVLHAPVPSLYWLAGHLVQVPSELRA